MTDMDNFEAEFARIKGLGNTRLVAKELKAKSFEFRDAYNKKGKKMRNDKYHAHAKDKNNENRREKRKADKEAGLLEVEKPITHIATPLNVEEIDTTIKREYAENKKVKDLTENTIKGYGNTIKALYNKYHDKPIADDAEILKYLRGEKHDARKMYKQNEYIIKNIKDIAENHTSSLSQIYSLFSRFNTKKLKEFREAIYPYKTAYNKHYQEHRNDFEINEEEVAKISFVKEDVLANAEKIEDINLKVLYMLVFMLPVRRLSDYRLTLIAEDEEDTKNEKSNWYYNNKIYINTTKDKKKIILDIPNEITSIINEIIIPAREAGGDFMFLIGNYSQPYLSEIFSKLMVQIYDSHFTATNIRKIYASHNLKTAGETGDVKQMLKNQREMGHALREHLQYVIPLVNLDLANTSLN
jgi:hypothetical protein